MIPWNKKTASKFMQELSEKRPDLTTEDVYVNNKAPMLFTCAQGHEFYSAPNHILNDKTGCRTCSNENLSKVRSKTTEEFLKEFESIESPLTILGEYVNARVRVDVVCDKGHYSSCLPSGILRGNGCRQCVDYGKFRDAPVTLYYVRILHEGKKYYKVGLTQRGVSRRFVGKEGAKITCLYEEVYDSPLLAWESEQSLIRVFKEFITKDKVLRKGNTEVFCCDVLHMDNIQENSSWH